MKIYLIINNFKFFKNSFLMKLTIFYNKIKNFSRKFKFNKNEQQTQQTISKTPKIQV